MIMLRSTMELVASVLAIAGVLQVIVALIAVWRFARRPAPALRNRPPVTILKPLHGAEPLLIEALESVFRQDYPTFQIVFGVSSPADPAIAVVRELRHRYPNQEAHLVIDSAQHGTNRKISNLINMLPSAHHDLLVIADSDVHAAPDYLNRIVGEFDAADTVVVTTLYAGRQAHNGYVGRLGSSYISHVFLPGALLARVLGRQDCLGATMALRRNTLLAVGGLEALVPHVADDAILGQLALNHGLAVRLSTAVPTTTVPEIRAKALFQHELRWARTIRSLAPVGHALSLVQFPIAWSIVALAVSAGSWWPAWLLLAVAWTTRATAGCVIDRLLQLPDSTPILLMPARDLLCAFTIFASFAVESVRWRGHVVTLRAVVDDIDSGQQARYGHPVSQLTPADDIV